MIAPAPNTRATAPRRHRAAEPRGSRWLFACSLVVAVHCGNGTQGNPDAAGGTDTPSVDGADGAATDVAPLDASRLDATPGIDAPLAMDVAMEVTLDTTSGRDTSDGSPVDPDAQSDTVQSDVSTTETSSGDADAGPSMPCVGMNDGNCVPCSGSTGGVCSVTEALFAQIDLNNGRDPNATNSCYSCMVSAGALDDPSLGQTGLECDDLEGTFDAGAGRAQLCLATLSCMLETHCYNVASGLNGIASCFCVGYYNCCGTTGCCASAGACQTQEQNGFGLPTPYMTESNLLNGAYPSGVANGIIAGNVWGTTETCPVCQY